ncbi:P-loop containing nucleoside triphosphate hydrolase protein [Choiromyces venosus 120613-1]|uniref:Structural maintenance of chromosomes protein 5 n=1 Tax=Choiromyces venosus 120613-1 TaxID=1336337 RepID=A0A3N4JTQ2_9PEZI|nr:P-loop containing nucleoside triphosphate hydrolase protein [Choiromyces venosus 120613-1]
MPSLVHKRSAPHPTDNSESEDLPSRESSAPSGNRKRARTILEEAASDGGVSQEDSGGEDSDVLVKPEVDESSLSEADSDREEQEVISHETGEIERNTQPFQPGSIVRIKAENFVTYTAVEFFPGPNLNMVIGPNGTGKSTIVCAICLGLGSSPANLGRAKEISEFVKHGCETATIEIELQGKENERNPVIKRKIGRENNTSTFTLNGSPSTSGKITKLVKSYNIQIDNLCQFLPQDRVVEFAGLTAIDLLTHTQRAAAPPEILGHHENLKKLGKRQKELLNELEIDRNQLTSMEARQAALQQDVERLRERQEIIKRIELLEKARPFVKYRAARGLAKDAKDASKVAERELRELEQQVEPMTEAPKAKRRYHKALERFVAAKKKELEAKERAVTKFKDDVIGKADEKITDITDKIDAARSAEQGRKQQIAREREKIAKLKKQLEEDPPEVDLAYYNRKIGDSNHEVRDMREKIDDIDAEIRPMVERANQINGQISRKNKDLQDLSSVIGVRERMLERMSSDTHQVWQWIKTHQDKFEQEILGPPVLTCNVTEPKYADVVESQLGKNDKLALVAQNKNDYRKLLDVCFGPGPESLKLRDVTIRENSNIPIPSKPISSEEARGLGFDGFTIDLIDGPAPVLSMLCQECRLHTTPISFREFTAAQNKNMENTRINRWVTGRNMFTLRRRYNQVMTNVTSIRNAQAFAAQQVDTQAEQEIRRSIGEMENDLEDVKRKIEELKDSRGTLVTKYKAAQAANQQIKAEKSAKQQEAAKYVKLKATLASAEEDLKRKMGGGEDYKENIRRWRAQKEELVMGRAVDAEKFANLVKGLIAIHNELILCQIRFAEAGSDAEILQRRIEDVLRDLETKRTESADLARRATECAARARELQGACRKIIQELSPEESEFMNQISPEKNAEDIETDIEAENARLDLLHEGNPNAIKQYEDRATKIQNLEDKIVERKKNLEKHSAAIVELRGKWEPVIDRLVAKISVAFSKSFEKINCAGEVRVHKEEDEYDKWAIQILVKFRANENLQILTNQRQSGGERAVSTVFYLMALQSLARSPFRVVDEINQGMDPRNERLVHHRMVSIACQEYTSQYFLITPKLLPDLSYHKRMKVHCIFSGDWLEPDTKLDPDKYLRIGARMKTMAH